MTSRSQFYPTARQKFATASLDWTAGNTKCLLMAAGYIPNFNNVYLSDIPSASIIATSPNIVSPTSVAGVLSGNTINFGPLIDPRLAASLIFYRDTGVSTTSLLICYVDTPDVLGMPAVLNGFNYYVYQNAVGGWFQL